MVHIFCQLETCIFHLSIYRLLVLNSQWDFNTLSGIRPFHPYFLSHFALIFVKASYNSCGIYPSFKTLVGYIHQTYIPYPCMISLFLMLQLPTLPGIKALLKIILMHFWIIISAFNPERLTVSISYNLTSLLCLIVFVLMRVFLFFVFVLSQQQPVHPQSYLYLS